MRTKLNRALTAMLTASIVAVASAQDAYPSRPITLIIGFPPGGGADNVARQVSEVLSRELGQTIIVENKAGAGTTIAAASVARANPDGYTLYLGNSSLMGGDKMLYKNITYSPEDFVPVTRLTVAPLLLVASKSSNLKSVPDLLARARQEPGKLNFASSGNGVVTHLAGVHFARMADVQLNHIPYKGGAPAMQSIAAGDTQVSFATIGSARALVDGGKAVALAVTSGQRSELLPQYPTIAEGGVKGYNLTNWWGIFVPAKTPSAVIDKLFSATLKALTSPELKAKLAFAGEEISPSKSTAEFKEFAIREGKLGVDLIQESGAKVD